VKEAELCEVFAGEHTFLTCLSSCSKLFDSSHPGIQFQVSTRTEGNRFHTETSSYEVHHSFNHKHSPITKLRPACGTALEIAPSKRDVFHPVLTGVSNGEEDEDTSNDFPKATEGGVHSVLNGRDGSGSGSGSGGG
jgi:hypothetical protein